MFARMLLAILLSGLVSPVVASPTVFWASDPIQPGQTAVIIGEGFGKKPKIAISRVSDVASDPLASSHAPSSEGFVSVDAIQASDQGLKFTVPSALQAGIFAYRISTEAGVCEGVLNRPQVWWAQGDRGLGGSPGGWIRIFGRNLGGKKPVVRLEGDRRRVDMVAKGDEFALLAKLPADVPIGKYRLFAHNRFGDQAGWSEPIEVEVANLTTWPATVFNVRASGAEGDGVKDDTAAVLTALDKADKAGGGVVYFPRGRYRLSDALSIPRAPVLRGEKRELSCLAWSEIAKPPESLIRGTNSFGIEDLTIYAKDHRHVIAGDLGDQPGCWGCVRSPSPGSGRRVPGASFPGRGGQAVRGADAVEYRRRRHDPPGRKEHRDRRQRLLRQRPLHLPRS